MGRSLPELRHAQRRVKLGGVVPVPVQAGRRIDAALHLAVARDAAGQCKSCVHLEPYPVVPVVVVLGPESEDRVDDQYGISRGRDHSAPMIRAG